ncbi:MAG: hypothetical protein HY897_01855 [Deltaproteobacteria bacterium]|nr:hypothetical protein [Deltaproteobacteria bacterium]
MPNDECRMTNASGCPSSLALDAWVLDGRKETDPLHAHVKSCPRCTAQIAELDHASDVFRRDVFPATVGKVVRLSRKVPWYERIFAEDHPFKLVYTVPMLTITLILLVIGLVQLPFSRNDAPQTAIKGTLGLTVFVEHQGSVRELFDGETVFPGDRLRFRPAVPADGFLMVVSVQENGSVNLYYPPDGDSAMKVAAGSEALPGSIVLDESTGGERVFVLYSSRMFSLGEVKSAIQSVMSFGSVEGLKALPLEMKQATTVFRKEAVK